MSRDDRPFKASQVEEIDGKLVVNVDGEYPVVQWPKNYTPRAGDFVKVARSDAGSLTVVVPTVDTPRPMVGRTSGGAIGGRLTVVDEYGATHTNVRYIGDAPADDTLVALIWTGSIPWAFAGAAPVSDDPATLRPAPVGPPPAQSGNATILATATGSWRSNGTWEYGEVKQGSYGGWPSYRGAWFYGHQADRFAGLNVNLVEFYLPPRVRVGAYNSSLTANLRIAGLSGPGNWPAGTYIGQGVPAHYPGGWIPLPSNAIADLIAGNGLGIDGGAYMGFVGADELAISGQLRFHWTT